MGWFDYVLLRILTGSILTVLLIKYLVNKYTNQKSQQGYLFLQFLFCAGMSLIITRGNIHLDYNWWKIISLGLINSFGCFCYWKAIENNLGKSSLFTQGDDIIAFFLAAFVLGEITSVTKSISILVGIITLIGVTFSLIYTDMKSGYKNYKNIKLLGWVAGYSLSWGIAVFSIKYFTLENLPMPDFILPWYVGSAIGTFIIKNTGQEKVIITINGSLATFLLSIFILASMALHYWAFELEKLLYVQPIFMFSRTVFPALMGLFIFKEARKLERHEKLAFIIGWTGIAVIAAVYYLGP